MKPYKGTSRCSHRCRWTKRSMGVQQTVFGVVLVTFVVTGQCCGAVSVLIIGWFCVCIV